MICSISGDLSKLLIQSGTSCVRRIMNEVIILFFHYPIALGLWHRLFSLVGIDWVPPCTVVETMTISFKGFRDYDKGKVPWGIASLSLIWSICWKRNARIF